MIYIHVVYSKDDFWKEGNQDFLAAVEAHCKRIYPCLRTGTFELESLHLLTEDLDLVV